MEQSDIVRHHRAILQLVLSGAIQSEHGECPHLGVDFMQVQDHGEDISAVTRARCQRRGLDRPG